MSMYYTCETPQKKAPNRALRCATFQTMVQSTCHVLGYMMRLHISCCPSSASNFQGITNHCLTVAAQAPPAPSTFLFRIPCCVAWPCPRRLEFGICLNTHPRRSFSLTPFQRLLCGPGLVHIVCRDGGLKPRTWIINYTSAAKPSESKHLG